jgi:hypothetical protein
MGSGDEPGLGEGSVTPLFGSGVKPPLGKVMNPPLPGGPAKTGRAQLSWMGGITGPPPAPLAGG